jgi:hypothetical protein
MNNKEGNFHLLVLCNFSLRLFLFVCDVYVASTKAKRWYSRTVACYWPNPQYSNISVASSKLSLLSLQFLFLSLSLLLGGRKGRGQQHIYKARGRGRGAATREGGDISFMTLLYIILGGVCQIGSELVV